MSDRDDVVDVRVIVELTFVDQVDDENVYAWSAEVERLTPKGEAADDEAVWTCVQTVSWDERGRQGEIDTETPPSRFPVLALWAALDSITDTVVLRQEGATARETALGAALADALRRLWVDLDPDDRRALIAAGRSPIHLPAWLPRAQAQEVA